MCGKQKAEMEMEGSDDKDRLWQQERKTREVWVQLKPCEEDSLKEERVAVFIKRVQEEG